MTQKISYSAIVLTDESHNKLVAKLSGRIPEGWEIIAHHVTIKMGELPPDLKPSIGLPTTLKVIDFHMNDKVAACQVVVPSEMMPYMANKYPHITIAVNRAGGGKPVMSNDLIASKMKDLTNAGPDAKVGTAISPIELIGQIQEVPNK